MTDWLGWVPGFAGLADTVPVAAEESLLLRAPGPDIRAVMPPAGEAPTADEVLLHDMARVLLAGDLAVPVKLSLLWLRMREDQLARAGQSRLVDEAAHARERGDLLPPRSHVRETLVGAEAYLCPQIEKPGAAPP